MSWKCQLMFQVCNTLVGLVYLELKDLKLLINKWHYLTDLALDIIWSEFFKHLDFHIHGLYLFSKAYDPTLELDLHLYFLSLHLAFKLHYKFLKLSCRSKWLFLFRYLLFIFFELKIIPNLFPAYLFSHVVNRLFKPWVSPFHLRVVIFQLLNLPPQRTLLLLS